MVARYETKRDLRAAVGQRLRFHETSMFGPEYTPDGSFCVVGPDAYDRKWFAQVTMRGGRIARVD